MSDSARNLLRDASTAHPEMARGSGEGWGDGLNDLLSIVVPYAVMVSIFALPLIVMGKGCSSTGEPMGLFNGQAFDEDAWLAGNPAVRGRMAKSLERSGALTGLDEYELVDLLDDPDSYSWAVTCWLDAEWGRTTWFEAEWREGDEHGRSDLFIGGVLCSIEHLTEQRGLSLLEVAARPPLELPSQATWNDWNAAQRTECLVDLVLALRAGSLSVDRLAEWEIADGELDVRLRYELDKEPHGWVDIVLRNGVVESVSVFTPPRDYSPW